jgi:hypothetical protein
MHCGSCGRALIEIRMRFGSVSVTLRRCVRCDSQTWETADGEIPLAQVLDLARST